MLDADIVHYISYSTWRATVWMLFRALDHRDAMPDPLPEEAYFSLNNVVNAAFYEKKNKK